VLLKLINAFSLLSLLLHYTPGLVSLLPRGRTLRAEDTEKCL
jgi:hypothetical protein